MQNPAQKLAYSIDDVTKLTGVGRSFIYEAIKAGNQDPQAVYLLAMCLKHLGRTADARQVLGKIADFEIGRCAVQMKALLRPGS